MFRKLISNLPFNPSLIGQVSFYAKRMHREESIRRIGFGLVSLALVLQVFAVISPPEQTLARVGNDLIPGGAVGGSDSAKQGSLVNHCNANNYDFATILDHFGISCLQLFAGQVQTINANDYGGQLYSMGRAPYSKPGEVPVNIAGATYFMRPLNTWGNYNYQAITGNRADGTPFMILFDCGNLVIVGRPPAEKPPKSISCAWIDISTPPTKRVAVNTTIAVLGNFSGSNLPPGQTMDMYYDYVVAGTTKSLEQQRSIGIPFNGGVARDSANKFYTLTKPGHYQFRLAGLYDGGQLPVPGSLQGGCVQDVYVDVPPPEVKKVIVCSNLVSSFGNGQKIIVGSSINVRGQATGRGLSTNEKVDMYYDYVDSSGKVIGTQKALGVKFEGSKAEDQVPRTFKLDKPGSYTVRLAVKYDNGSKTADGSLSGDCAKKIQAQEPCKEGEGGQDDKECLILSKKATNETQQVDNADGTVAQAGDTITYTLATKNTSKDTTVKGYVVTENMIDVLQYADILNLSGGTKDQYGVVSWPAVDIKPGQTINKKITIKVKNPIPQTPVVQSDPGSYDMKLTNIYGNTVNIKLPPNIVKTTEYTTRELPNTGPGETLAVGFVIVTVVGYFFARSRLIAKEVDIIRSEYAASGSA